MDLKGFGKAILAAVPTIIVLGGFEPYLDAASAVEQPPGPGSEERQQDEARARSIASSHMSAIEDSLRMALQEMRLVQRTLVGSTDLQSQMDLILDAQRRVNDAVGNARQHDVALQQVIARYPAIREELERSGMHPELKVAQVVGEDFQEKVTHPDYLRNPEKFARDFDHLHGKLVSALQGALEFNQGFQSKVG